MFTPAQVDAAIKAHSTIFFDMNLNPVVPQEGQWFCEYEQVTPEDERPAFIRDEALVEYVCEAEFWCGETIKRHMVIPESAEGDAASWRETQALFLVRQS